MILRCRAHPVGIAVTARSGSRTVWPATGLGIGNELGASMVVPHGGGVFARFFRKTPPAVTEEITFKQRVEAFWTWYTSVADRFYQTIEAGKCGDLSNEVNENVDKHLTHFAWVFGPGADGQRSP